ncbi:LTA synthase family protein [Granulicatella balaenopterae]|nr:alkaline phosphatase family protein [Granulicatella balaenopterae]
MSIVLPTLIVMLADYYFFKDNKKGKLGYIKNFFLYGIVSNVYVLAFFRYGMNFRQVISPSTFGSVGFVLCYILLTVAVGALLVVIEYGVFQKYWRERLTSKTQHKKSLIFYVVAVLVYILGLVGIFMTDWFLQEVEGVTSEQILFNLISPVDGASGTDVSYSIMNDIALPVLVLTVTGVLILMIARFIPRKNVTAKYSLRHAIQLVASMVMLGVGIWGMKYCLVTLQLNEIYYAQNVESEFIEEHYVSPKELDLQFPTKKRNLIHIYLESVETSYLSKELGGYMDENLMPELTELAKEGVNFSHSDKMGGPHQTYGSSWSMASMVNMTSGLPLKFSMQLNQANMGKDFYPGAITLGDILAKEGYNQTLMIGSSAVFAAVDTYYTNHGHYKLFDYNYAIKQGLIPKDYYVWWGFEDEKLYQYAKEEITRLASEGEPFNFTMENGDTHFPDGYLDPKAEQKYDQQYANVIAYSSKEVAKLVRWIQEQPFYDDTTIILTGDHLSMDKHFFEDFDPNYERTIFNVILNPATTTTHNHHRDYAPFDFYPTILAAMGVTIPGNHLGLGTNLFSNEPTLIEQFGEKRLNNELSARSDYFNKEIIDDGKEKIHLFEDMKAKVKE